jgi:hypothetical protein
MVDCGPAQRSGKVLPARASHDARRVGTAPERQPFVVRHVPEERRGEEGRGEERRSEEIRGEGRRSGQRRSEEIRGDEMRSDEMR